MVNRMLTKEQKEYLYEILPFFPTKIAIQMIKDKFGFEMNKSQIDSYRKYHKIKIEYENTGHFKKNHKIKSKPLYSEIESDKDIRIKVGDNKWIVKQRYIYEKYKGKIPDDYVIMFLDGNSKNYDIDNLIAVPRNVRSIKICLSRYNDIKSNDIEINKTLLAISELENKKNNKEKKEKQEKRR